MKSLNMTYRLPRLLLVLALTMALTTISVSTGPLPARGANGSVLLVVGDSDRPSAGEAAIADRFAGSNLSTTFVSGDEAAPAEAELHDLVWISSTVKSRSMNTDLPDIESPVIVSKPWLLDDYGLTEATTTHYGSTTTTEITITDPADPTAGGLTGSVQTTHARTRVSVANPTTTATIVATANDTPTIFRIEPGQPLADDTPAPACRLSFPAFHDHPATYTPKVWTLFDATTAHALTDCAAAPADRRILFGMHPGDDRQTDLVSVEKALGRQLDMVRVFERWDAEPDEFHQQIADRGQTMVLSVRAKNTDGSFTSWRTIADALPGSPQYRQMVAWAHHVKNLDTDVIFSFNHEPEIVENIANGDAQDYIDAWRRFREIFQAEGVENVQWAWIMTAWSFHVPKSDRRFASTWFPGDDVVDVLGVDAYNWSSCHPSAGTTWRPLTAVVARFRQFADRHPDQDLLIAEWATTESPAGNKEAWVRGARTMFTDPTWDRLIGVSYFNDNTAQPTCSFPIDSSPGALAAMQGLADDTTFGGE